MKLSSLEKLYINSFFRAKLHQPRVLKWFLRHIQPHAGATVLEIGCGRGTGLALLANRIKPEALTGLDFDPDQVQLAVNNTKKLAPKTEIRQGDAAAMPFYETTFHYAFCFGALHHVPNWQRAITETARVLKPGGYFMCEEVYRPFLNSPIIRSVLPHPQNRFTHAELLLALAEAGLDVVSQKEIVKGTYGVIVAQKQS